MSCAAFFSLLMLSAPAPPDALLNDPFAHQGAVRVLRHEEDANGLLAVILEVPYRDVKGAEKKGQARLFVARDALASGTPLRVYAVVHYPLGVEADETKAKVPVRALCASGWLVVSGYFDISSPEDDGAPALELCTGDSHNFMSALLQYLRRLPFADRTRLHLDGDSAGGYMALAMAAETFPVRSVSAYMPVVNWSYNLAFFEANKPVVGYPDIDPKTCPVPVLGSVTMLTDWSYGVFGDDLADARWYALSPVSQVDRITAPVLCVTATGDILVPASQFDPAFAPALAEGDFPAAFDWDFEKLTRLPEARRGLVQHLAPAQLEVFRIKPTEANYEVTLGHFIGEEPAPPSPPITELPWSANHQWSLVLLEEGPPRPFSTHTRLKWNSSPRPFAEARAEGVLPLESLTAPVLEHLMRRYAGDRANPVPLADGTPANRQQFTELEQLDVILALQAYVGEGEAHAARLEALYQECPFKPFGPNAGTGVLAETRDRIMAGLGVEG